MTAPAHVLVFRPLIALLRGRGADIEVTAREYAQTVELLEDVPVQITLTGADLEGLPLTFSLVEGPLHGTLSGEIPDLIYSPAPDFVVRYRLDAVRGHLQAGSVFRSLGYHGAARNTTTLGAGFNVAGAWKAANADLVIGSVTFGRGVARYIDTISGTNSDLDLDDAGTDVAALPAVAAYGAFTHFWPNRFRTTGTFGYGRVDTSDRQLRKAFAAQQESARRGRDRMLASVDVDAIAVRTDRPYVDALRQFFRTRERRRAH